MSEQDIAADSLIAGLRGLADVEVPEGLHERIMARVRRAAVVRRRAVFGCVAGGASAAAVAAVAIFFAGLGSPSDTAVEQHAVMPPDTVQWQFGMAGGEAYDADADDVADAEFNVMPEAVAELEMQVDAMPVPTRAFQAPDIADIVERLAHEPFTVTLIVDDYADALDTIRDLGGIVDRNEWPWIIWASLTLGDDGQEAALSDILGLGQLAGYFFGHSEHVPITGNMVTIAIRAR